MENKIISALCICLGLTLELGAVAFASSNNATKVVAEDDPLVFNLELTGWSKTGGKVTINEVEWTYTSATYLDKSVGNGVQIGSSKNPQTAGWTISTDVSNLINVSTEIISSVSISAMTGGAGTYAINVGTSNTNGDLKSTMTDFALSNLIVNSGTVSISITGTTKAQYLQKIEITKASSSVVSDYVIAFNSGEGSGKMQSISQDEASFELPACDFVAPNEKEFDAWAIGSATGTKYNPGDSITLEKGTTTFYALWKELPDVDYTKLDSTPDDWSGEYLIVSGTTGWDSNKTVSADGTYFTVTDDEGVITTKACHSWIISSYGDGYSIKTNTGVYLVSANKGATTSSEPYEFALEYNTEEGYVTIRDTLYQLCFNASKFRFYTSFNGSRIYLYKKAGPAKTVTSIAVSNAKTDYYQGETFVEPTVTATYDDASSAVVTGATFTGYNLENTGAQTVTVSYKNVTTTYQINVGTNLLQSIELTGLVIGRLNLDWDLSNVSLIAHYEHGDQTLTSGFTKSTSTPKPTAGGEYKVTVVASYGGKNTSKEFTVQVSEVILDVVSIEATTEKTTLYYGDSFTKNDVKVVATYSDGSTGEIACESISGFNSTKLGNQMITVSAGGKTCELTITVFLGGIVSLEAKDYTNTVEQGKEYNFDGKVIGYYADGSSDQIDRGYIVEKVNTDVIGPQTVKISYDGQSVQITINVVESTSGSSSFGGIALLCGVIAGVVLVAVGLIILIKKVSA